MASKQRKEWIHDFKEDHEGKVWETIGYVAMILVVATVIGMIVL